MLLSHEKLVELVRENKLLENIPESELTKAGGVSFDLRVGEIHEFTGEGFLGVTERKTPETKLLAKHEEGKSSKVVLEPNKYYIVKTLEKINCPMHLASTVVSRSTLFRSGVLLLGGLTDPGYNGELAFGMMNINSKPFTIEMGARIANILFFRIDGKTNPHVSPYQGGNIGTK